MRKSLKDAELKRKEKSPFSKISTKIKEKIKAKKSKELGNTEEKEL